MTSRRPCSGPRNGIDRLHTHKKEEGAHISRASLLLSVYFPQLPSKILLGIQAHDRKSVSGGQADKFPVGIEKKFLSGGDGNLIPAVFPFHLIGLGIGIVFGYICRD